MKKVLLSFVIMTSSLFAQSALAIDLDAGASHKIQNVLNLHGAGTGILTIQSIISEKANPLFYYRLGFDQGDSTLLINSPENQPVLQDLYETLRTAGAKVSFVNAGTSYYWLQVNLTCTSVDSCSVENTAH